MVRLNEEGDKSREVNSFYAVLRRIAKPLVDQPSTQMVSKAKIEIRVCHAPNKALELTLAQANAVQDFVVPTDHLLPRHLRWRLCILSGRSQNRIARISSRRWGLVGHERSPDLCTEVVGQTNNQLARQRAVKGLSEVREDDRYAHQICSATRDDPPAAVKLTSLNVAH